MAQKPIARNPAVAAPPPNAQDVLQNLVTGDTGDLFCHAEFGLRATGLTKHAGYM